MMFGDRLNLLRTLLRLWCYTSHALPDLLDEHRESHPLCSKQPFLATIFYEDLLRDYVLDTAEHLREQAPTCTRFRIRADQTIKFVADQPETGDDYIVSLTPTKNV